MKKVIFCLYGLLILILASCSNALVTQYNPPIYALGTVIDVTFYNTSNYKTHYEEIKSIYLAVDKCASDFESNHTKTSVYDLNELRSIEADDLLIDIINEAVNLREKTNGYFNPFIGKLSHIWKESLKTGILPNNELLQIELENMNNTSIIIDGNTVTLAGEGNLDLGAIAKGYATQLAKDYLDKNNVTGYLINAGASNLLAGSKGDKKFSISLPNPIDGKYLGAFRVRNVAIGTSSIEHQRVEIDNKLYHHIINPFTGYPSNNYDNVNIVCDNSAYADVYSTAVFSMDLECAKEFIEEEGLIAVLSKYKDVIYTNGGDIFVKA